MAEKGMTPGPNGEQTIDWRRFAILGSGVITSMAVIRLIADAAGVPRGTAASAAVSAFSNFVMCMTFGLSAPFVIRNFVTTRPLLRRIMVLVPLALACAFVNYLLLVESL